jgi:hypothetical protein
MRQIQLKQNCAVFIGRARFKKSQLIIKYFLNSNSAGANFTLATTVACAVYSVALCTRKSSSTLVSPMLKINYSIFQIFQQILQK